MIGMIFALILIKYYICAIFAEQKGYCSNKSENCNNDTF